mmetsp:Transcript_24606/g.63410  ORF Transcript_24606/g.63410 Transcript_24606/m.63410 type:complete len:247 (-) Transcript_24606:160-900(-)
MSTAFCASKTPQKPSQARRRKASLGPSSKAVTSGTDVQPNAFIALSPNDRATCIFPCKRPSEIDPPAFSIRARSDGYMAKWSLVNTSARSAPALTPPGPSLSATRASTHFASPQFATSPVRPTSQKAAAQAPSFQLKLLALARTSSSVFLKASIIVVFAAFTLIFFDAPAGEDTCSWSTCCSFSRAFLCNRSQTNSATFLPPWPSKTAKNEIPSNPFSEISMLATSSMACLGPLSSATAALNCPSR